MTVLSTLRQFGQGLLHLVYPNACWVCLAPIEPGAPSLCTRCDQAIGYDPHASCPRCASTVGPYTSSKDGCTHCKGERFHFDRVFRLGLYDGVLREVILRVKYSKDEGLAEVVGNLWARQLPTRLSEAPDVEAPDVVVPVPLHWSRKWSRGFNQSDVLARALAAGLRVPCHTRLVYRRRRTPQQAGETSRSVRHENVRGAFALRRHPPWAGKTILLVDDVLTTGATASAVALVLRALKPAQIIVAVLAHDRARW